MAEHLAMAKDVLSCAERTLARARNEGTLDAAATALRQAIEDGTDIGAIDPVPSDKPGLDDAVAAREIAERAVVEIEAVHASAMRLVARRKAAVDAAELALITDIAMHKAAEVETLRERIAPYSPGSRRLAVCG